MNLTRFSLIAAVLCAAPAVHAAAALPGALVACARVQDSLQRLVCYDREMAAQGVAGPGIAAPLAPAPPVAVAPPPASLPPASAAPPAAAAPTQLGDELVKRKERPAAGTPEASLTAAVTKLREERLGIYLITLDNGQIWRQQEMTTNFLLHVGETVRIDRGALGSYMLKPIVEGRSGWIRVTRVK